MSVEEHVTITTGAALLLLLLLGAGVATAAETASTAAAVVGSSLAGVSVLVEGLLWTVVVSRICKNHRTQIAVKDSW
jgi:hypothetical protein